MDQNSTFLVEFSSGRSDYTFRSTTVFIDVEQGGKIIQSIQTGNFTGVSNYWMDWGGHYDDVPLNPFFTIFIEQFLTRVDTKEDLLALEYTSFIVGDIVYFHIPFYLWQIEDILSRLEFLSGYSTNVPDFNFPSSDRFDGRRYPTWMSVPSLPLALSNPVNGVNLSPTFSIVLDNSDNQFDSQDSETLLNNPITVRRSTAHPATLDTFKKIRVGEIENVLLDMDKITLQGADALRTLEDPACRTFSEAGLSDSGDTLPIAYGTHKNVSLKEISEFDNGDGTSTFKFIACDPEYVEAITNIKNSDGLITPGTVTGGVLSAIIPTDDSNNLMPDTCTVKGRTFQPSAMGLPYETANKLGAIIRLEVSQKTKLVYTDSFWNTEEVESYIANSPTLDFWFTGGSVKSLITNVLKNDMAFFIQQNSGLVTLRKWGTNYAEHSVPSWMNTIKPKRKFSEYKYYYSSIIVNFNEEDFILNSERESVTAAKWKKKARGTFETSLRNENQATRFSNDLLDRFANRAQLWDVGIGQNTSGIELLDSLYLTLKINNRVLSKFTKWKIIGINPGQDVLTIEEDSYDPYDPDTNVDPNEVPLSQPTNENESGYLSHPSTEDMSGVLSQNSVNE